MSSIPFASAYILASVVVLCGCTTPRRQQQAVHTNVEIDNLNARFEQVRERLDASENRQDDLTRAIEDLKREFQSVAGEQSKRVTELSSELRQIDAARARDRDLIVEQISTRMSTLIKQQQQTQAARFTSSEQSGYEHIVKEGQTLSEIASAYGVTMSAIAKANKLPDRNTIRVGQKLFIPE